jgi:hypothetical protein
MTLLVLLDPHRVMTTGRLARAMAMRRSAPWY